MLKGGNSVLTQVARLVLQERRQACETPLLPQIGISVDKGGQTRHGVPQRGQRFQQLLVLGQAAATVRRATGRDVHEIPHLLLRDAGSDVIVSRRRVPGERRHGA